MQRFLLGLMCLLGLQLFTPPLAHAAVTTTHHFPVTVGEHSLSQTEFHELLRSNSFRLKPEALGHTLTLIGFRPQLGQLNLNERTSQAELEAIAERAIYLDALLGAIVLAQTNRLSNQEINQAFTAYRNQDYSGLNQLLNRWSHQLMSAKSITPATPKAPATTKQASAKEITPTEHDNAFLRQVIYACGFSIALLLGFSIWLLATNAALRNHSRIPKLTKQIQELIAHEQRRTAQIEKLEAKIKQLTAENCRYQHDLEMQRNRIIAVPPSAALQSDNEALPLQQKLGNLISDCSKNLDHKQTK